MVSTPPPRLSSLVAAFIVVLVGSAALGQEALRIGAVLPGRASVASSDWDEMLAAHAWERVSNGGTGGLAVELHWRDGGTDRVNTAAAVDQLLTDQDVHAIVCCTTPAAANALVDYRGPAVVISLARPTRALPEGSRLLVVAPGPLTQARAMTLDAREFGRGVGLMTLDNDFGKEIAAAVVDGLIEAGLPLARAEAYRPGSQVLTPEALLVAASDPGAVIVWGLAEDTLVAVDALRARGFSGQVYLPWETAAQLPGGPRNTAIRGARLPVPPTAVADALPPDHANVRAVRLYAEALAASYGGLAPTAEGAMAFDAFELLLRAGELAMVYGVVPVATDRFRQALLDGLVALEPIAGAAGSYDYDGRRPQLALARGLVIATTSVTGLVPVDR